MATTVTGGLPPPGWHPEDESVRFVQIATTVDEVQVYLFALDSEGVVWERDWRGGCWRPLSEAKAGR
jgi:hypothetical protein